MMLPERRCSIDGTNTFETLKTPRTLHGVEAIEIGAVGLQDRADVADAGAVDQDVEAAGVGQHLLRRTARIDCSSVTSSPNATAGALRLECR